MAGRRRGQLIRHEVAGNWKAYADRLAFRADSILVQLSDQEFEEGLAALRRHAVTAPPDEPVTELSISSCSGPVDVNRSV